MSFVIGVSPVGDPNQKHGQRHPSELVPIEKWKTEEDGIVEIIEWNCQQGHAGYQQQPKTMLDHAMSPFRALKMVIWTL
jgi:hypothetical protein